MIYCHAGRGGRRGRETEQGGEGGKNFKEARRSEDESPAFHTRVASATQHPSIANRPAAEDSRSNTQQWMSSLPQTRVTSAQRHTWGSDESGIRHSLLELLDMLEYVQIRAAMNVLDTWFNKGPVDLKICPVSLVNRNTGSFIRLDQPGILSPSTDGLADQLRWLPVLERGSVRLPDRRR